MKDGKFTYREYRPGKWQVYFSHKGKQIFIQKHIRDGKLLTSQIDAEIVVAYLKGTGYDPQEWGKDRNFNFDVAAEN